MLKTGCAGLVVMIASTAAAAPARPDYRPDGSVRVGNETFKTISDYYASTTFQTSGARCGSEAQAGLAELAAPGDCSMSSTTINPEYNDNRVFIIQTVFHVIKKTDGTGALTPALIESQLDVLNEDFLALAGTPGAMGSNTKVKFVLARKNPAGQPTTGINVVTNDDYFADPGGAPNNMKQALAWDPTRYFNIYTNDAAGYLGYATFPAQSAGTKDDGVVLLWSSVGRNSPNPPYHLGRTATHEVGHWLGLYHTFQGGCGQLNQPYSTGDLISDTPREQNPAFGCTASSTCQGTARAIENYMNYTDDACMTKFTPEQSNRVRCSLINYRFINTAPTAEFTFAADMLAVTFTNTSMDAQTPAAGLEYKWTFGDGMTSTEASPSHTYAADGTYEVILQVWDPGSGAASTTQSVVVTATAATPDAGPGGDGDGGVTGDGGGGNPDSGDGGGCCESRGGGTTSLLCAIPLVLVLRRRRRSA
ncbi:MAG TPA: M43 family zinc metalloprotease [Kofleriaceae bacterium]